MGRSLSVVATAAATAGNNASTPPLQGQSIYGTGQYRVWAVAGTYQWTSPITGTARGRVTGAGGGGAAACKSAGTYRAGGGGGGGFAMGEFPVVAGTTYVIGVGVGGIGGSVNGTQVSAAVAGGSSTIGGYSPGVMSAAGGEAGKTATSVDVAPAAGGIGVGGTITRSGGSGGGTPAYGIPADACASGGGASGSILGTGGSGGSCGQPSYTYTSPRAAGGGAAGGISAVTDGTGNVGGGGGAYGAGRLPAGGPGLTHSLLDSSQRWPGDVLAGSGGGGIEAVSGSGIDGGSGAGGGGFWGGPTSGATVNGVGGAGGPGGGGGGAAAHSAASGSVVKGGGGGLGGGGGGAAADSLGVVVIGGTGGDGMVVIEW